MSGKQLTDSVDEVFDLVRKSEGIISTFSANEVAEEPETVEAEYERFADTDRNTRLNSSHPSISRMPSSA